MAPRTRRTDVVWCGRERAEYDRLCATKWSRPARCAELNPTLPPNSYLALSDPADVARVEDRTFICSRARRGAGPTEQLGRAAKNAADDAGAVRRLHARRTMYVVPFSMGPLGSHIAHIGIELTDSPYVVVSMKLMTRWARRCSTCSAATGRSCRACTRSARRWRRRQADVAVAVQPRDKYIVHFPETREIWSYGSGYGGNALLGKKCFALRIASVDGARRGLARRAHADPRRHLAAAKRATSRRRFQAHAARPTSRC
jgi:phosphoenolpyruvate carboxykinase (GTP)